MARLDVGSGAVVEKLLEFDRCATRMHMPQAERLGILNVSDELYRGLRTGKPLENKEFDGELARRLSYALPMMRRLANTTTPTRYAA